MSVTTSSPLRGPVRTSERALAPDLARGLMLLLIAVANTPWYLYGADPGMSAVHARNASGVDAVVQFGVITTVDMRVYPMFAFLFGYGMVQLFRRQTDAGTPEKAARRILRRRNWWLLAFGFLHAALLWFGDVLGAYGLAGLVMVALFFRRRDKTLITWAALLASLLVIGAAFAIVGSVFAARAGAEGQPLNFLAAELAISGETSYARSILARLESWPVLALAQGLFTLVIPIALLLSFWAARRQVLEQPGQHLVLLRRTAVAGITLGWLGGVPHALNHLDILAVPDHVSWVFLVTQSSTGLLAGLGYVAAFALLAHRIAARGTAATPAVQAITAVGRRSLSCYLAQSVVFAPILSAWGLGLGAVLSSATVALFAIAVWLATAVLALAAERRGLRGPAEVLLRRLVYGGTGSAGSGSG
jgi:uncharacterized protein